MSVITTAVSGLNAAVAQLTASASNLANAQSSGPLAGARWGSSTIIGPSGLAGPAPQAYQPVQTTQSSSPGGGVATSLVPVSPATQPAYAPSSPYADAQGLVAEPNIDPTQEIVGQLTASQAYKANLATLRIYDEMQKTLLAVV